MTSYTDPGQHLFWITSRALGIVALLLISASVGIGLGLSSRVSREPGAPGRLKHFHEALSLTALAAIAGHGLLLLGDSYLRPGIAGIALPFALNHRPFWTGLGVIGGWLAAVLGLSFYVRRWIGTRTWRKLHRWTLAVYALGVLHTIGAGSDGGSIWLIAIVVATGLPIALLAAYRWQQSPRAGAPARSTI